MKASTHRVIRDYFITVLTALGIALIIRTFVIEAYRIPSLAMKPTLITGDILFATKWPYSVQKNQLPERGDIIVYSQYPQTGIMGPDTIKRVVGLPGDEVSMQSGNLILNRVPLKKINGPSENCFFEFSPEGRKYQICKESPFLSDFGPQKVPLDSVFAIGDLRSSIDQKKKKPWGMVHLDAIKGKAVWLWLSIDTSKKDPSSGWLPKFRRDRMFSRIQ